MMSNFGALMEASMERKKKRKATWEREEKASEILGLSEEREYNFLV